MKTIIILSLFLFSTHLAHANAIDSLKTIKDVEHFLEKLDKSWKDYPVFEKATKNNSRFGKNKFFKIDLDNNGSTDLVINGKYLIAVTAYDNGKYVVRFINRANRYTLTSIKYSGTSPLLVMKDEYSEGTSVTLIFKFGDFIEFNPAPADLKIEKINFSTTGCYGTCPVFDLSVNAYRTAFFNAISYNDKKEGKFTVTIDTAAYNNLIATINYMKLTSLKDNYFVGWTDDQTALLEITYNNGQTKKIRDYGEVGTFGLANLYKQLFALRETQKWK